MVLLFVSTFSAFSIQDFLVEFAVGGYVIRFTTISTLAYCVPVSVAAFNNGPLALLLLFLLLLGVSRLGVTLGAAGRRFCCCRCDTH